MGRLLRFFSLIVALGLGFGIGAGVGWLNGQNNPTHSLPSGKLIDSIQHIDTTEFIPRELVDLVAPPQSKKPSVEFKITGIVDILPELKGHLKKSDSLAIAVTEAGHTTPIAVKKISPASFPFLFTIGPEDMVPKGRFSLFVIPQQVSLTARVGDLIGRPTEDPFSLPARDLHVLIDRVADVDHVVE